MELTNIKIDRNPITNLKILQDEALSGDGVLVEVKYIDSFGDGWNGATLTIRNSGGSEVYSGTLDDGFERSDFIFLKCETYTIEVTEGDFPSEISWELIVGSDVILNGGTTQLGFNVCNLLDPDIDNYGFPEVSVPEGFREYIYEIEIDVTVNGVEETADTLQFFGTDDGLVEIESSSCSLASLKPIAFTSEMTLAYQNNEGSIGSGGYTVDNRFRLTYSQEGGGNDFVEVFESDAFSFVQGDEGDDCSSATQKTNIINTDFVPTSGTIYNLNTDFPYAWFTSFFEESDAFSGVDGCSARYEGKVRLQIVADVAPSIKLDNITKIENEVHNNSVTQLK